MATNLEKAILSASWGLYDERSEVLRFKAIDDLANYAEESPAAISEFAAAALKHLQWFRG